MRKEIFSEAGLSSNNNSDGYAVFFNKTGH